MAISSVTLGFTYFSAFRFRSFIDLCVEPLDITKDSYIWFPMEKWTIDATDRSPLVLLDRQESFLRIEGRSYPEEGMDFFDPIIVRFKTLENSENPIRTIHIRLEYYNSATSKALSELFQSLSIAKRAGHDVKIVWEYEEEDDGIQEDIDMFIDTFDLPFEIRYTDF